MIPLFEYGGNSWLPLGLPMSQNRMSIPTWSYAMEMYPPSTIIELGSFSGGFTIALGVHAWNIGCKVHGFEIHACPHTKLKPLSDFLGVEFHTGDLFKDPDLVRRLVNGPGVTYLLCDNGNKKKEFNEFAGSLKHGDVIAAHDYCSGPEASEWWPWREIVKEDVAKSVAAYELEPWMQQHFDMAGWLVYKRK